MATVALGTRRHWTTQAARWERWESVLMNSLASANAPHFRALELEPGHRVADFACGIGDPALAIAQWVGPSGRVLGTDIAASMLAVARRRAKVLRLSNVEFRRADMSRFAHRGPRFDRVSSRYGIMFASDPAAALGRMRDCLRSGGRIALTAWGPPEGNPGHRLRAEAILPFLDARPLTPSRSRTRRAFNERASCRG